MIFQIKSGHAGVSATAPSQVLASVRNKDPGGETDANNLVEQTRELLGDDASTLALLDRIDALSQTAEEKAFGPVLANRSRVNEGVLKCQPGVKL